MADLIKLTEDWVTVTAVGEQPLYAALDVLKYDILDLMIMPALNYSGGGTMTFGMTLLSGNYITATGSSWKTIYTMGSISSDRLSEPIALTLTGGFFQYLRWNVTTLGNLTSAKFRIEGVGRTNS